MDKKEKRRGIPMQPRIIITALIVLAEVILIVFVSNKMISIPFPIYTISEIISIITVIYLINSDKNPSYKIAWIVFILLLPVAGLLIFAICGGGRVFPHVKRKMSLSTLKFMPYLSTKQSTLARLEYDDLSHSRQAIYLSKESGFPVYSDTDVHFIKTGEEFFPLFIKRLSEAEHFIYLEYFIIAEGKRWSEIEEVLFRKAAEGVEIKIIFDDFGSIKRQRKDFLSRLRSRGIKIAPFNPIVPTANYFINNRDHRKIAVIDGNIAFTGGINLADEYDNTEERFGHWLDNAVMLEGKAVDSFTVMFCIMWQFITGHTINVERKLLSFPSDSGGFVLPYCDGPTDDRTPAQGIYLQMLSTAQRYVYISTPYLIIDNTMINALTMAAKSGIDVRITVPHIPDKKYVHPVTKYNYAKLLKAGVRIYEYLPGFIHSKVFVSDDKVATVGSVNMDYRSFVLHFECGVWMSGIQSVIEIRDDYLSTLEECKEIKYKVWKRRSLFSKFIQWILHILAPFM